MKEAKRFAKQHKVLTTVFALSGGYAFIRTIQAMKKPEGEFWPGMSGIGHVDSAQKKKLSEIGKELRKASKMHKSQADRIKNLGATTSTSTTTSSSHPMNRAPAGDMMKHPTALFGYRDMGSHCTGMGAHCTARGNPHCPCAATPMGASYGDDTNKSPLSLMGTPNAIKRRTMRSNMENAEVYMSARESHMFSNQRREDPTAEDVMGDLGMVDTLGATGWM